MTPSDDVRPGSKPALATDPPRVRPFWGSTPHELAIRLQSRLDGLTAAEAADRLARGGRNSIDEQKALGPFLLLLRQFESPLVLILLFGAVISMALREWMESWIIIGIVAGSALLGFFQEFRASRTVAELKRRLALTSQVRRGGADVTLPAAEIVPGDVILLSAGALVPADGLVIEAEDFLVNEASLTGESFPVEKRPGDVPVDAVLSRRTNAVFLGSSVQSGTAKVLIAQTGRRTEFGAIAERLRARQPETDFARGVRRFGYLLVRVMIVIVFFVLTVNLLLGRPVNESLLFAVALAVGLSPELLPAIISVTLSAGARTLAARGVIVRRLEVIENLGAMDVLCTDKTGTLTEGVISLADAVDPAGLADRRVRRLAFINAALETGIANPLDAAIVRACQDGGMDAAGIRKIDEIPYDFRRKFLTIVVEDPDRAESHLMVVKGAFANVLARCDHIADGDKPLTDADMQALSAYYEKKGTEGFRVLGLATRRFAPKSAYTHDDEASLTFAGFLLFSDPPKQDADEIVRDLAALGVAIKVVSGDNRYVTAHLAETIGLDPHAIMTGDEIARTSDDALWQRAERTSLFVEVDPQQKERVVRALQRRDRTVGYLGDGINDAPALHAADVGISVDDAVDVARESADIILLQRDLDVLRQGVEGGRRTFANTLKYINITTSANFGNMISMALVTPFLPFMPLLPKQILLNNFLSDLPSVAISTDRVDESQAVRPQRWDIRSIRRFMIVFGLVSSFYDLVTFALLFLIFRADAATFQTVWFLVSLLTELAVVMVLRTRLPFHRSRPGAILLRTTIAVAVLSLVIPYLGFSFEVFGLVPLSPALVAFSVAVVAAYVATTEVTKRLFYRAEGQRPGI
jgi:Mg2+-importing ATPase